MLKKLFYLTIPVLMSLGANAQLTATIGNGSSTGSADGPIYRSSAYSSFDYSKYHYLFTQSELSNAGLVAGVALKAIAWRKGNSTYTNGPAHLEIWVRNSTRTSVLSPPQSMTSLTAGATKVYDESNQMISGSGWKTFNFDNNFIYTGGALEVTVAWDISGGGFPPTNGSFTWKRDYISNRTIYRASSSNPSSLTSNRSTRAQTRFTYDDCLAPGNLAASNITISSADFTWDPVNSANSYEYAVTQTATPPSSGTSASGTNGSVSGLTMNTLYYLHVRSKCGPSSYSAWGTDTFTTDDAYCKPPVNVLYANLTKTSTDIIWSAMQTSDWYEYKVDLTPNAPPVSQNAITTANHFATATNLMPDTKYYVYLRSFCLGGSDSSKWHMDSFTTRSVCDVPDVSVLNMQSTTPVAYWPRIPEAVAYEYIVTNSDDKPSFGAQIADTFVALTMPNDNEAHYLHVRSKCNSQFTFSDWNTTQLRDNTTSVTDLQGQGVLQLYPNPAKDVIYLESTGMKVYIITDMRGAVMAKGSITEDVQAINTAGLPAGMYILQASGDAGKHVSRFTKQ